MWFGDKNKYLGLSTSQLHLRKIPAWEMKLLKNQNQIWSSTEAHKINAYGFNSTTMAVLIRYPLTFGHRFCFDDKIIVYIC